MQAHAIEALERAVGEAMLRAINEEAPDLVLRVGELLLQAARPTSKKPSLVDAIAAWRRSQPPPAEVAGGAQELHAKFAASGRMPP